MPSLTLTFDNGPEPDVTPGVLDALGARGIKATFFVVGEKMRDPSARALAERAHDEGHWIGNHTFSHSVPLGLSGEPDVAAAEIGRTQALIGDLAHPDRLFRPFGGQGAIGRHLLSTRVVDHLVAENHSLVLWNAIPRDWEPEGWVERALAQIAEGDETLMVLHDLPTGAMQELGRFLDAVQEAEIPVRQTIPDGLMPIRRGRVAMPIAGYVSDLPERINA